MPHQTTLTNATSHTRNNNDQFVMPNSPKEIEEALKMMLTAKYLAVNLETTGTDVHRHCGRILGLATDSQPLPLLIDMNTMTASTRAALNTLFSTESVKIAYSWLEIIGHLWNADITLEGVNFDVQLAAAVLSAGRRRCNLDLSHLTRKLLDPEIASVARNHYWRGPLTREQLQLAARRTGILLPLRAKLVDLLVRFDLVATAQLEFECLPAMAEMQWRGIGVDRAALERVRSQLIRKQEELRRELRRTLGETVNLDSPQQVQQGLALMGYFVEGSSPKDIKTDALPQEVLEVLGAYRSTVALERNFVSKSLAAINSDTGRIYSQWHQHGAATGRISCSNPPLQGTPKLSDIRACFVPQSGNRFVIGDLSQIELRVAAEISGDRRMIAAFRNGQDLHRLTAALITDKPLAAVTDQERQAAKAVNFGLLFGMGAETLMKYAKDRYGTALTSREARIFREKFFKGYPELSDWIREQIKNPTRQTRTLGGRRRIWNDEDPLATELINSPIQGTAADILKKALALLPEALVPFEAMIVACIHDEIILEAPKDRAAKVAEVLRNTMEKAGAVFLREVPTEAKVRVADSWAENQPPAEKKPVNKLFPGIRVSLKAVANS